MAVAGLTACSSSSDDGAAQHGTTAALLATGGAGKTGNGGEGGKLYAESSGSIKILKSGTVDASFTVTAPTPSYGAHAAPFGNRTPSLR